MTKDIGIAIFVGFVLGILVAIAAINLPKITTGGLKLTGSRISVSPSISQVKTIPQTLELSIDSPKNESVSDDKTVTITGRTKPSQTILVETDKNQDTTDADSQGAFKAKIDLSEGINTVYLTIYDESGNPNTKALNIYYTTEKL